MLEWLKVENLIGKLNFNSAGWFKGWFKRENNTKVVINFYDNEKIAVEKVGPNEVPIQFIKPPIDPSFDLNIGQKFLVDCINSIHKLHGMDYNFEISYHAALDRIRNKETPDWSIAAAAHLANAIQSGSRNLGIEIFFNSFEIPEDPKKEADFVVLKEKIGYCYKRLQNLRHIDKSGELKDEMISPYQQKIADQTQISDINCEEIFKDFQNLLSQLFNTYPIKKNL